jgi:DNA invertase Pin-like site-specific DNA recombinase
VQTVLGGLAEFERELIRARTGEGRARGKARGVKMGASRSLPITRSARRSSRDHGEETLEKFAAVTTCPAGRFRGSRHE